MSFQMYVPTRILFGAGELGRLHAQAFPGHKAMLVISNGKSTRENGYLARTERELQEAGVGTAVFDRVQPNPLKSTVMEGAAFARENGYEPDISETRRHHEIYLSDPRKAPPEKWKTVLRHPIRKA